MVGICRLCASIKPQTALINIFNKEADEAEEDDLCERILICFHLDIAKDDPLPNTICPCCENKLNTFYKCYKNVQEAQESLRTLFPFSGDSPFALQKSSCEKDVIDITKPSKPNEIKKNPIKIIKKNSIDLVTNLNNNCSTYNIAMEDEEEIVLEGKYTFLNAMALNDNEVNVSDVMGVEEATIKKHKNEDEDEGNDVVEGVGKGDAAESHRGEDVLKKALEILEGELDEDDYEEEELEQEDDGTAEYIEILEIQKLNNGKGKISQHNTRDWLDYPWYCCRCPLVCESLNSLLEHSQAMHDLLPSEVCFKCAECQKVWEKYFSFLNHVRFQHRGELILCCDCCNQHFVDKTAFAQHRELECLELSSDPHFQLFHCTTCGRGYQYKQSLALHLKLHSDKNLFNCPYCSKFFRKASNLKVHISRVHSEVKSYKCDLCEACFSQKINLTHHMFKHTDDKPFVCSVCNKNFKTSTNLQKHALLHTEKKEFKCNFCDTYFRTKDATLSHERTHTKEKPYQCPYCDKSFSYRSVLKPHINTHTGHRPFKCPFCTKEFTNWSNYNKHTKRIHKITATEISKGSYESLESSGSKSSLSRTTKIKDSSNLNQMSDVASSSPLEEKSSNFDFVYASSDESLEQSDINIGDEFSITILPNPDGDISLEFCK